MKKIMTVGVLTTSLISVAAVTSCGTTIDREQNIALYNKGIYKQNEDFSLKNNSAVYKSVKTDIVEAADEADINLFFATAVAPFTNLLRLSLLDKTENHFFMTKDRPGSGFESKVNTTALEDFYNNGRVGVNNNNSAAVGISGNNLTKTVVTSLEAMKKIIMDNPSKKINVGTNALHVNYGDDTHKFFDLLGFKNVNIQLVEDGSTNYASLRNSIEKALKESVGKKDSTSTIQKIIAPMQRRDIVRSGWSNPEALEMNKFANNSNKNPYQYFAYKELSDGIFNARDVNGKRLMSTWPIVSGLDGKDASDIVETAKSANGLPSLIVLGSYGVPDEEKWIKDVGTKYHSKYNIFYKGHPGHMDHPLFVTGWMQADKPENMYQLEPMISSEELTRDHIVPVTGAVNGEKYIQFDKVAVVGHSSAVKPSAFPNLDLTKDVIEVYDGTTEFVNPLEDPVSTNGQPQADWLKSL